MSLAQYRSKRDLRSSHDPEGNRSTEGQLRFVIQKHAASRLHYDFRLELDGVLKSWAIPKGPSLDPSDRRLAVMVEDHPLDYLGFEGTLPEGSYGAGTVMVWDQGTYSDYERAANRSAAVENLRRGLENGEIRFILNGKKLRGAFVLVKMRPKQGNNYWLLIKKRDEFADDEDPLNDDISVVSGRSFEEIMAAKNFRSNKPTLDLEGAAKAGQPKFLEPMLATLVDDAFDDPNWITEVKWDG
ncbi:MAG: DNA ligase, partial [Actinomycetota bacterium]|nr:DNA ligase [Actinomycetota bacterium]